MFYDESTDGCTIEFHLEGTIIRIKNSNVIRVTLKHNNTSIGILIIRGLSLIQEMIF